MNKTLTIIGAGKVGKTLGRLWSLNGTFTVQDVLTRSALSAQQAVDFIDAGRPIVHFSALQPADIYLIAVPDDQIESCCAALADTGLLAAGNIVFHCSGARSSALLSSAAQCGAAVASIHPIRSFAIPAQVVKHFAGTYCGAEGEAHALALMHVAFTEIGAEWVMIDTDAKIIYHAASVFASNYLVTLLDVAQQAYVQSGIAPDVALKLMGPLVRETTENVLRSGTLKALTGPIARGDLATVETQQRAVATWDALHGALYDQFVPLTMMLAARKHTTEKEPTPS